MKNSEVVKKIKILQKIQPRTEWKKLSHDFLLSQIKYNRPATDSGSVKNESKWKLYISVARDLWKEYAMQPAVAILLIFGLVVGSSLTVNAAFYSLPGDLLYPLKISLERTQLALVMDNSKKTELRIEFVKKRIDELDKAVAEQTTSEVKQEKVNLAANRFRKEVNLVKQDIQKPEFAAKDKEFSMAFSVDLMVSQMTQTIDEKTKNFSDSVRIGTKDALDQAIDSAENISISALSSIINKISTTTDGMLTQDDLNKSLNEKISSLEQKIVASEEKLNNISFNSEEKEQITALIDSADMLIAETKTLLLEKSYDRVLANITQLKSLIKDIEGLLNSAFAEVIEGVDKPEVKGAATSTVEVIDNEKIKVSESIINTATSTILIPEKQENTPIISPESTPSETTDSLIK